MPVSGEEVAPYLSALRLDGPAVVQALPRAEFKFHDLQAASDSFRESGPEHRAFIRAHGGPRSIDDIDD